MAEKSPNHREDPSARDLQTKEAARKAVKVRFRVPAEGKPEERVPMEVYVFDAHGRFFTKKPVGKDTEVEVELPADAPSHARVFFAPDAPDVKEDRSQDAHGHGAERAGGAPTLRSMQRMKAYEPSWTYRADQETYTLKPIPLELARHWFLCACRVRGRVVRPVVINGITHELPVCNARVHICEVDPWYIILPKLPDYVIDKWRWWILKDLIPHIEIPEIRDPRPGPFPEPQPGPDPVPFVYDVRVVDPSPEALAKMQPTQVSAARFDMDVMKSSMLKSGSVPPEMQAALSSTSIDLVRSYIVKNPDFFRPYLCRWPWLQPYYSCDELRVVQTDDQGRFDVTIWHACDDQPDLYFWVEYCLGGAWTPVHRPPRACNTHWNYVCGTEVTIRVTDPRVPWCGPAPTCEGGVIAVLTVGMNESVSRVQTGGATEGLTDDGVPFGGSLEPTILWGNSLSGTFAHYRWSVRKVGASGSAGDWRALTRDVVRHYLDDSIPATPVIRSDKLGPDPVGSTPYLYRRQPILGPGGAAWTPQVNPRLNAASGFFESWLEMGGNALAAAGKYELKLEFFDAAGARLSLAPGQLKVPDPSIPAPFGPGPIPLVDAPAYNLYRETLGGPILGFRMVLLVDNNPCEAVLYEASVDGDAAGPCGFIDYAPANSGVLLRFKARHPFDWATYAFNVVKGSTPGAVESSSGRVTGVGPGINGYARDAASVFSKSVPVAALVGSCPGGKAAFAETLAVHAMATDGWSRLSGLDGPFQTKAFALEPETP